MSEIDDLKTELEKERFILNEKLEYMKRLEENNKNYKATTGKDSEQILEKLKIANNFYNRQVECVDELIKKIEVLEPKPEPTPEPTPEPVVEPEIPESAEGLALDAEAMAGEEEECG